MNQLQLKIEKQSKILTDVEDAFLTIERFATRCELSYQTRQSTKNNKYIVEFETAYSDMQFREFISEVMQTNANFKYTKKEQKELRMIQIFTIEI